jgi:hypothetical protein
MRKVISFDASDNEFDHHHIDILHDYFRRTPTVVCNDANLENWPNHPHPFGCF